MTSTPDEPAPGEPADLAAREHLRRERAWHPAARWQAIQETIRWAEAQASVRRNTPQACIARERRLLEGHGLHGLHDRANGPSHTPSATGDADGVENTPR